MTVPAATVLPSGVIGSPAGTRRFAVLGAGFAGVSVAWHLLQHTTSFQPICVDVFDEAGVGGGASGASGGLLHPFNPKGKLLWKGAEGWAAALRLLAVAEGVSCKVSYGGHNSVQLPLSWRRGILRLARREKDALSFRKNVKIQNNPVNVDCLGSSTVMSLVPGLEIPEDGVALHIPQAINIHPQRYLQALWFACEDFARQARELGSPGTKANFQRQRITSLYDLAGSYEAVVVCLGAQALLLPELAEKLPLSTCRGVVVNLQDNQQKFKGGSSLATHAKAWKSPLERMRWDLCKRKLFGPKLFVDYSLPLETHSKETPNLMSSTWMAIQDGGNVLLGATKDWGSTNSSSSVSGAEKEAAINHLLTETGKFFPSISEWEVKGLQAGLRAMPPRTPIGSTPLAGCIDGLLDECPRVGEPLSGDGITEKTKWWLLGGLGSRGLIYHGWLGAEMAKAVILRNDDFLPLELKRWTSGKERVL